jgi:hypothetical protein
MQEATTMKLTKYNPIQTGKKRSLKVTYNETTNTTKLRFRKADGSVDGVRVYQSNDPMILVDMYRWNKFSLLPESLDGTLIGKTISPNAINGLGEIKSLLLN